MTNTAVCVHRTESQIDAHCSTRATAIPVKNTRSGERAVPARNATTKAKMTGRWPMFGSTVNWRPYQNAATPARNVPIAKQTR